ncbi:hypothetical protein HPG69_006865 [Diceros bicornis minor]|uniref:Olfactory receptor n=1 Tax=Diceros bicornis minor TaxID=77932 RepID=A0A7J7ET04_DICBM|nr:hypothetical protein HPG69_006865 [Diceros bicornis minor]
MSQRLCPWNHSDPLHNLAACLWLQCHRSFMSSYVIILYSLSTYGLEGRCKALSTYVSEITEVILVFVPCMFIYLYSVAIFSIDKAVAVFCQN